MPAAPHKIVLTGAPGSGKTTACRRLVERHRERLVVVPEAATQYYTAIGRRWDQIDLPRRRDAQRGIYALQTQNEARLAREHPDKHLLLDRGTIDGAAYWPEGPDAYWPVIGTTLRAELLRYHTVIVLESAAAVGLYDGAASNQVRFETAEVALADAHVLEAMWLRHPRAHRVAACHCWEHKLGMIERLVIAATESGG